MPSTTLSSQIKIRVDGTDVAPEIMADLVEVIVDQHAHLPGMFSVHFRDPRLDLIDGRTPFNLTKEVEIFGAQGSGSLVSLIKGEITAVEPILGEGMTSEAIFQGYDKSHRLYRTKKSRSFLNIKDSDLVSQIASGAGLSTGTVDTTSTVYEHLYQHNQSDMAFLMQRACRIGYECYVAQGQLHFHRPDPQKDKKTLEWGQDLIAFQPRLSTAEQVDQVLVKGWDPKRLEPIVGQATPQQLFPAISDQNGTSWASRFGQGDAVIVDQPVASQAEADALAKARANEISGSYLEATGVAYQRPDIQAGKAVEITGVGTRLSGTFLVTSACHVFTPAGLKTTFHIRGTRSGLLAEQMLHQPPLDRWPGVVPAIVTDTNDPQKWGRVKIKYPWMTEDTDSGWARVISSGAGPQAGFCLVPEVGDEVMVVFEHGDFNQPYVIGGVWNGKHKLPPDVSGAANNQVPLVRVWQSRTGHKMVMFDNTNTANAVQVITAAGHSIKLDDKAKKIEIKSTGGLLIEMDDNSRKITIKSGGDVVVEATANVSVKASAAVRVQANSTVDISSSGPVNIKGAVINLQ